MRGIEERGTLRARLVGAAFRAGRAFGEAEDTWSYAAFLAIKVAF